MKAPEPSRSRLESCGHRKRTARNHDNCSDSDHEVHLDSKQTEGQSESLEWPRRRRVRHGRPYQLFQPLHGEITEDNPYIPPTVMRRNPGTHYSEDARGLERRHRLDLLPARARRGSLVTTPVGVAVLVRPHPGRREVDTAMPAEGQLVGRFGRVHDDLRISVTDRRILRCVHCIPEDELLAPLYYTIRIIAFFSRTKGAH